MKKSKKSKRKQNSNHSIAASFKPNKKREDYFPPLELLTFN